MAKKKEADVIEANASVEDIVAGLQKKFGDTIFVSGDNVINRNRLVIPVSPSLDTVLGGGIPEGSLVISTGKPKVGKTSMCLDFAGTAQQPEYNSPEYGPRRVFFHNIEMRLKERDLKGIKHLITDKSRLTVVQSMRGNILTAEKHVAIALEEMTLVPGCIVIFDSFSSLCTQSRLDKSVGESFRDSTGILLSDFLKRAAPIIAINDIIMLGVNHQVANTGGTGMSPWSETGGRKVQYGSDVKLNATYFDAWKIGAGDDAVQIGQEVHWKCDWSAIGAPGGKCVSKFRYNHGIDKEAELIEIAKSLRLIQGSGTAWLTMPDGTKLQGAEKARAHLLEDRDMYNQLYKDYRTMLGLSL